MKTKKLKFHQDAFYNGECVYKAGEIADVPVENGYALRWEKRGMALEVVSEKEEAIQDKPRPRGAGNRKQVETVEQPKQNEEVPVDL